MEPARWWPPWGGRSPPELPVTLPTVGPFPLIPRDSDAVFVPFGNGGKPGSSFSSLALSILTAGTEYGKWGNL